jgi:hypothetical protein
MKQPKPAMTKEEFKARWEKDEHGDGITNDEVAECAIAWGVNPHPRTSPIGKVIRAVVKASGAKS